MGNDINLPGVSDLTGQQDLSAGCFSSWLRRTRYSLIKENGVDVHCGECAACCMSSYFIHIRPEETQTKSRIPKTLLFPAPLMPRGNVLLGYNEKGCCPMLIEGKCSVYEHRPLTCRSYDCRIFTAAGITAGDGGEKALISQQIRRWKFSYPTPGDKKQHAAVQAAGKFLREHAESFPAGVIPRNETQLAILAIKVYHVFLKYIDVTGKIAELPLDSEMVKAVMETIEKFASKGGNHDHRE